MNIGQKAWIFVIIGTLLMISGSTITLMKLGWPYTIGSPILAGIGAVLITNGWRLLGLKDKEKPYKSTRALSSFKRHLKEKRDDRTIAEDVNLWEAYLIQAAKDCDYTRMSELLIELILAGAVTSDRIYGIISDRVESFVTRFSDDPYVLERALPAILGVVEHFHEQKFDQGVARCLVTFNRVCLKAGFISNKRLNQVAQSLATLSKSNLRFREIEALDVEFLSLILQVGTKLNALSCLPMINDLSGILTNAPKIRVQKAFEKVEKEGSSLSTRDEIRNFKRMLWRNGV